MKLLVFAHKPPPHHGQSYMVQLMLDGLARPNSGVTCYHVNVRLSDSMEDIGGFRMGKVFRLLGFCAQAIWLRLRYGVDHFYYIPAPAKRNAIYRDWLVLGICRPFFRQLIFHWHAYGLGGWIKNNAKPWEKVISRFLYRNADLSIVLSEFSKGDAMSLKPKHCAVVPNGIPDPCPNFEENILPQRSARMLAQTMTLSGTSTVTKIASPNIVRVLFLGHCTRTKGFFDTLEGFAAASGSAFTSDKCCEMLLTIGGAFLNLEEEGEFNKFLADHFDCAHRITYRGFINAEEKQLLLAECDVFCFPTFYPAEGLPVSLLEAMAFGMDIITTRWSGIPEAMPVNFRNYVDPEQPSQIADCLSQLISSNRLTTLRQHFLDYFTLNQHITLLAAVLTKNQ